jgi:hypothetical protein
MMNDERGTMNWKAVIFHSLFIIPRSSFSSFALAALIQYHSGSEATVRPDRKESFNEASKSRPRRFCFARLARARFFRRGADAEAEAGTKARAKDQCACQADRDTGG